MFVAFIKHQLYTNIYVHKRQDSQTTSIQQAGHLIYLSGHDIISLMKKMYKRKLVKYIIWWETLNGNGGWLTVFLSDFFPPQEKNNN